MKVGGNILKALFRTAATSNIYQLHTTLENLQTQNSDIVHPFANQITLVKRFGQTAEIHAQVTSNLSSIIENNIVVTRKVSADCQRLDMV
jgi:hypothetical protein